MEVLELIDKLKENYEPSYIAEIMYHEYPEFSSELLIYLDQQEKIAFNEAMEELCR